MTHLLPDEIRAQQLHRHQQRAALIDHVVEDHGADDEYRFPALEILRTHHTNAHSMSTQLDHTHDGSEPWTQ